ncbi:hypothetical protein ISN44_As07g005040 [Arabidopsis suecica]|uniref:Uncharacterized protein n=1 Tax=Arabidopsis suecica TaxID=45249 RepID=A0A8T2BP11_ARASU|nr:hypothetical protein ISN44_As07g005040 [Arabidopsis suecica]
MDSYAAETNHWRDDWVAKRKRKPSKKVGTGKPSNEAKKLDLYGTKVEPPAYVEPAGMGSLVNPRPQILEHSI